ncbi:VOC family protein [Paenibacillus beijingensis]|uniref:VOC domain-containing protein n=1 Tax=Paenibacillus beijingensis TaxID=1126833 RepID=A0A0D5NJR8_9BACL|nr:VOC family protein [Paenibacillus beijingensis]AJY75365.1 hypothetical protein VN24_13280 [Paenibacillus beijingensis]
MTSRFRLGSTAVYARDRKRLVAFYQTIFDMKLLASNADPEVSQLAFDTDGSSYDLSIVGNPNAVQIVFHAVSLLELKGLWERFKSSGIPARGVYVQREGISIRIPDPEGNQILILWPQNLHDDEGVVDWTKINDDEMVMWIHENRKRMPKGGQV